MTTENKKNSVMQQYASYYARVGAVFLELIFVAIACIPGMAVFYGLAAIYFQIVSNSGVVLYFPVLVGMLAFGSILPVYRITKNKQMKGYALRKLKIVRTSGEELTSARWAYRTVAKLVLAPIIGGTILFFVIPLMQTKGERHIVDFLFDTKAVSV